MFHVISKSQINMIEETGKQAELVTEASTLGLSPGYWPMFLALLDGTTDNGFLFMRSEPIEKNPEFGYVYRTKTGAVPLTVFND